MTEQTMTGTPLRAEVYLRGDTYGVFDAQQQVLNRVKQLEANATFSESLVDSEWQRIRVRAEDTRDEALSTFEEFQAWARRNDYVLEPAFEQRARTYLGTNRVDDVVVFPVIALALYDDRHLAAVFPCSDEERAYTVGDALEAFERDDEAWLTQFRPLRVGRTDPRVDSRVPPTI